MTMTAARDLRLIYIAPRSGTTGVGDYADDFLAGVAPHLGEVRQLRHGGPGSESIRDVVRARRELRAIIAERPAVPTIVHVEQSGGAIIPFWAPAGLRGVAVTATVHDPPFAVWWPFRTRGMARSRVISHGIHRSLFGAMNRLESRVNRSRTLFTLTDLGAERLALSMPGSHIVAAVHVIPERGSTRPVAERPLAVGLFGYVYRGKGFDALAELRAALDPEIVIRVAGRGTEKLTPMAGVEILGEVNGPDEDAFFDSIRLLVVPYAGRAQYGVEVTVASGTVSRALAYQTPVLATDSGAMRELGSGVAVVDGGPSRLAERANELLRDDAALGALQLGANALRERDTREHVGRRFLDTWEALA